MSDDTTKPWKKTEYIPKRFDELPPEPGWVPVSDVIRSSREDEAKKEAKKEQFKIKPPEDSDSEDDTKRGGTGREEKTPPQKEEKRSHTPSKKADDTSMPTSVDGVTQAMVEWALSPDHYKKKKPKPAHHDEIKPPAAKPSPSPLLQGKTRGAKERPIGKIPTIDTIVPNDDSRLALLRKVEAQRDVPRSSRGHKPHNPSGAARRNPQQPASKRKEQRPPYDEPSPDYDDDYKPRFPQYNEQYYREGRPSEDLYYDDGYGYATDGYQEYRPYPPQRGYGDDGYQEYEPYPPQQGYGDDGYQEYEPYPPQGYGYDDPYGDPYTDPYGDPHTDPYGNPGYDNRDPEYLYEVQRSPYQQPSPYYRSELQEYPREHREYSQPRSSHDVLY